MAQATGGLLGFKVLAATGGWGAALLSVSYLCIIVYSSFFV